MNRQTIPIHEIQVLDRQRIELGDIEDLASSIERYGLIQPIVINQDKRLIAGGRRLAAHVKLGRLVVDCVFRETLSADELHELELEENVRRKEMTWQERALNILRIHELKSKRSALEGSKWGMRETAEMLGIKGQSNVHYNNEIAKRLRIELTQPVALRRFWPCENMSKAWQLRMRDEEDALQADLAKEVVIASQTSAPVPVDRDITLDDLLNRGEELTDFESANKTKSLIELRQTPYLNLTTDEARALYLGNPLNPPAEFDSYYAERITYLRNKLDPLPADTIIIGPRLHFGSCITYMLSHPESVDHIITDPPYGIDMSNLDQQNTGMSDIDTVSAEHDVKSNEDLFAHFFPAAYTAMRDNGFLVLWCDIMQWQRLYDLAILSGFKAQRWPITWIKTHRCMNQAAQYNFTKSTEIAMVCRKGTGTLSTPAPECHILAAHDEYKDDLGHPFVKPFDVWDYIISHVSYEGQTILEPFAGRGSGVISIIRKKRQFIACELNTQHFNALVENIKQHYLKTNPNYSFK